jgi:hypothetical protein
MEPEGSLPHSQVPATCLYPEPSTKSSAPFLYLGRNRMVRDYSFSILAATLHIGGRSFIRNLRTRPAVVTGTHLSWMSSLESKGNFTLKSSPSCCHLLLEIIFPIQHHRLVQFVEQLTF